jgi:hypothetical protein
MPDLDRRARVIESQRNSIGVGFQSCPSVHPGTRDFSVSPPFEGECSHPIVKASESCQIIPRFRADVFAFEQTGQSLLLNKLSSLFS